MWGFPFGGANGYQRGASMWGEVFDPAREWSNDEGERPHWIQAGTLVFITFGMADAIPKSVLELWEREKADWLARRGYTGSKRWVEVVPTLPEADRRAFQDEFQRKNDVEYDRCHGRCLLRQPELARIVADAIGHFDGDRYELGDFVVMPNHVHLLAAFRSEETMRTQGDSWMHYTARLINRRLGERGKLWRGEPFDHLVRSGEQYEYLRKYIAGNPLAAGLRDGEYLYRRRERG
jgi:putative transposase